jgi:hypothetical protein
MTPAELSTWVAEIVTEAQERVGPGSIGAQQYYVEGHPQRFETVPLAELVTMCREEYLDTINYAVMMIIRLDRITAELTERAAHVT